MTTNLKWNIKIVKSHVLLEIKAKRDFFENILAEIDKWQSQIIFWKCNSIPRRKRNFISDFIEHCNYENDVFYDWTASPDKIWYDFTQRSDFTQNNDKKW